VRSSGLASRLSPTKASTLCEDPGGVGEVAASGELSNIGRGHCGFRNGVFGIS
jgi:hypothetical protein